MTAADVLEFSSDVYLFELRWEVEPLIQALRTGGLLPALVRRDSLVLLQRERDRLKAWYHPPLAASVLRCIDGISTAADQARRFAQTTLHTGLDAYPTYFLAMEQFLARKWVRVAGSD